MKATIKQQETLNRLSRAAACLGFYRFANKSMYPLDDAQRNLQGKTHYVDSETLSFFGGKVNGGYAFGDLFYILLTSQKSGFDDYKREYKALAFDVFGNVINEAVFSTSKAARDFYWSKEHDFLKPSFIIKHTKDMMKDRFKRMDNEKKSAQDALKGV